MSIVNISGYQFIALQDLPSLRAVLLKNCHALDVKGSILLSPEGINVALAGCQKAIEGFVTYFHSLEGFTIPFKYSYSEEIPFGKMIIKLKEEVITFKQSHISAEDFKGRYLNAKQLKQWLDEGKDFTLLDTRNRFEVEMGTFSTAEHLSIHQFSDFAKKAAQLPASSQSKPMVVFCTGGVRCEKAAPYLEKQGFNDVYQLEGGILNYFEQCKDAHFKGECFVFDERVGLDGHLKVTGSVVCEGCYLPVTQEQQQSDQYQLGQHCPHCAP